MKNIIQICPTYPPNIGGVGNYAKILSDYLTKKGINSKILISDYSGQKNINNLYLEIIIKILIHYLTKVILKT